MIKNYINILFIFILFLVILNIVNIKRKIKENFLELMPIDYELNEPGEPGAVGKVGESGPIGIDGQMDYIDLNKIFLEGKLKLGTKDKLFIPPNNNNEICQLAITGSNLSNNIKLKMPKSVNDNVYYIYCEDAKKKTDFYINNKEIFGDLEIDGSITLENENMSRTLPDDLIPVGTIFPFYMNITKNLTNGNYYIKSNNLYLNYIDGKLKTKNHNVYNLSNIKSRFSIEKNTEDTYYIININVNTNRVTKKYLAYDSKSVNNIIFVSKPNKHCIFRIEYKNNVPSPQSTSSQSATNLNNRISEVDENNSKHYFSIYNNFNDTFLENLDEPNVSLKFSKDRDNSTFSFEVCIPFGWLECNGKYNKYTYSTQKRIVNIPDLRNKFIIHESKDFLFNRDGSSDINIQLNENHLPKHKHILENAGNHKHNIQILGSDGHENEQYSDGTAKSNVHPFKTFDSKGNDNIKNYHQFVTGNSGSSPKSFQTTEDDNHTHKVKSDKNGDHTHILEEECGNGWNNPNSFNIMPNYYRIIYIIKVLDYKFITKTNNSNSNNSPSFNTSNIHETCPPITTLPPPTNPPLPVPIYQSHVNISVIGANISDSGIIYVIIENLSNGNYETLKFLTEPKYGLYKITEDDNVQSSLNDIGIADMAYPLNLISTSGGNIFLKDINITKILDFDQKSWRPMNLTSLCSTKVNGSDVYYTINKNGNVIANLGTLANSNRDDTSGSSGHTFPRDDINPSNNASNLATYNATNVQDISYSKEDVYVSHSATSSIDPTFNSSEGWAFGNLDNTYIIIDLGSIKTVASVTIRPHNSSNYFNTLNKYVKKIGIEISLTGKSFKSVVIKENDLDVVDWSLLNPTGSTTVAPVNPVWTSNLKTVEHVFQNLKLARYVKIKIMDKKGTNGGIRIQIKRHPTSELYDYRPTTSSLNITQRSPKKFIFINNIDNHLYGITTESKVYKINYKYASTDKNNSGLSLLNSNYSMYDYNTTNMSLMGIFKTSNNSIYGIVEEDKDRGITNITPNGGEGGGQDENNFNANGANKVIIATTGSFEYNYYVEFTLNSVKKIVGLKFIYSNIGRKIKRFKILVFKNQNHIGTTLPYQKYDKNNNYSTPDSSGNIIFDKYYIGKIVRIYILESSGAGNFDLQVLVSKGKRYLRKYINGGGWSDLLTDNQILENMELNETMACAYNYREDGNVYNVNEMCPKELPKCYAYINNRWGNCITAEKQSRLENGCTGNYNSGKFNDGTCPSRIQFCVHGSCVNQERKSNLERVPQGETKGQGIGECGINWTKERVGTIIPPRRPSESGEQNIQCPKNHPICNGYRAGSQWGSCI